MRLIILLKNLLAVTAVGISIAFGFGMYMLAIGIPKTEARNLYNEGVVSIQKGQVRPAIGYFRAAVASWPEPYIQTELTRLEKLSE